MSPPAHPHQTMDEEMRLSTIPGCSKSVDTQNESISIQMGDCCDQPSTSCCKDKYYRKLAIGSIICGFTCIGIVALINSVRAEEANNPRRARYFSRRARKYGALSICLWLSVLVLSPCLLALVSYLLTLID